MRRARVAIRLVAALQVALLIAVVALGTNPDFTGLNDRLDPVHAVISSAAWLAALGSLLAIGIAWRFWQRRAGTLWTRLHHTVLAASTLALAWFFLAWHIAATSLNY